MPPPTHYPQAEARLPGRMAPPAVTFPRPPFQDPRSPLPDADLYHQAMLHFLARFGAPILPDYARRLQTALVGATLPEARGVMGDANSRMEFRNVPRGD